MPRPRLNMRLRFKVLCLQFKYILVVRDRDESIALFDRIEFLEDKITSLSR